MNKTVLLVAAIVPSTLWAQETRQLDAHEHGHSALNIAIEGTKIAMELEAPGADIVGFEHAAGSPEDHDKIDAARTLLSGPLSLFVLPDAAGCTLVEVNVQLLEEHHKTHGDHADHTGHGDHDQHEEHAHDDDEHKHADGDLSHDDNAGMEGAGHTEFHAEYLLDCADPGAIDQIEFTFFKAFPNAQEVDVQMISDKGSQGFEVERDAPVLDLAGFI